MNYPSKILLILLCVLLQAACSSKAIYTDEAFAYDSLFKLRTDGDVAMACESARRTLLGQGYIIETTGSEGVKARKAYKSESSQNTFIEMNVVCLPEANGSTVFATGVLSTYSLKMSSSSASVGVSAIGSISLPIGQSADSLVKVSEETIDDKDFYRRFFASVDTILSDMQAGKVPPEPVAVPAAPAAAVAPDPIHTVPTTVPGPVPAAPATVPEPAPELPTPVAAPVAAPESIPAPAPPAVAPEPLPAQEAPAAVVEPEPAPAQATRAIAAEPEPTPAKEPPMTVPEQFPAHLIEPFE